MDADDRVEDQEGGRVVAEQPAEVRAAGLPGVEARRFAPHPGIGEVGRAVLGYVAEVARHHRVQRREGLSEAERVLDAPLEGHRLAPEVPGEGKPGRVVGGDDRAQAVVVEDDLGGGVLILGRRDVLREGLGVAHRVTSAFPRVSPGWRLARLSRFRPRRADLRRSSSSDESVPSASRTPSHSGSPIAASASIPPHRAASGKALSRATPESVFTSLSVIRTGRTTPWRWT